MQVDDGALCTADGLYGGPNQVLSTGRHHLDGYIVGDCSGSDEVPREVIFCLRRRRVRNLNLLVAQLKEGVEIAHFGCAVHWMHQRLVAITEVG